MKKLSFLVIVAALLAMCGSQAYALDWMLGGGQYLIEDDMLSAANTAANEGWDSHEAGGDIGAAWGSGTWFLDNSIYTDVDMTRKINETSSGRVSLEYLYWFEDNIDGFKWVIQNGDNPVVTIKTKGTSLYAVKPDGRELRLTSYKVISEIDKSKAAKAGASVPYTLGTGVRIDMDLDARLCNIYINGKRCGANIPMADNVINNIRFASTKEETGKLYITAVRCYRNYWVNETHLSSVTGTTLPSTFKAVTDGGTINVEQMNSQLWTDVSNLRFKSDGSGGELSYEREWNVSDNLLAFEYKVIDTEKKGGFKASFGNGMEITMDNGAFAFNGTTFYTNYYKNLWYNVKVIADYNKGICDVYLNNIKRLENVALGGAARNVVRFENISGANINIGLDDIRIYPMLTEPEDYVSEPQQVNSPLEVGMWSCSLWRTGKHIYGWDNIKPWTDREPVLGFYDEGNPEVNDWETKYMSEHGVDFQMFCWFKPDGSYANPIKTPNWSYALEDGLKYPTRVIKGWYFNSAMDDWAGVGGIETAISNGALHIKNSGADSAALYVHGLNINADDVTHIKVRLRFGEDTAKKTEIFFKNDSMEEFLWNYNFKAVANSGDFKDIYIKTSNNEFWTDEINSLYYNVFSGSGEAWIDSIELLGGFSNPSGQVVFDGEISPVPVENINGTAMLNIADTIKYFCQDAKFDGVTNGVENLKFAVKGKIYEAAAGKNTYLIMGEATLHSQTNAVGEAMRLYKHFGLPGIDMLCNGHEYTTAKQAQSVVHQLGKEGMTSEVDGVTNWDFDFRGYKLHGDWQAALGVTHRVPHLAWVSMKGAAKRDYPPSINYQSSWYTEYKMIEEHYARLNTALTRGKPVVKVGVIHPIESYWLHYGPKENTSAVRNMMDKQFQDIAEWLLSGQIDFDYISEGLFLEEKIEIGNSLIVGEMKYDVILVAGCETLRSTTFEILSRFRSAGGRLVFAGAAPKYINALKSELPEELYVK